MQGTMSGARRRGMQRTACMDNIKTCTGLSVEESIRMTEDRDQWRKYVHVWCGQPSNRRRLKSRTELCTGMTWVFHAHQPSPVRHLGFLKLKILTALHFRNTLCIIVPNFMEISCRDNAIFRVFLVKCKNLLDNRTYM